MYIINLILYTFAPAKNKRMLCNFEYMAKAVKKKSSKKASDIFHSIMAASVVENPKPKKKNITKGKPKNHE